MQDEKKGSYPGYPHYPSSEDITRDSNNNGRQPLNPDGSRMTTANKEDNTKAKTGTDNDADVTGEDLAILDAADQGMDMTDSSNLQQAKLDSTDEDGEELNEGDLDVPGADQDDADEQIGEEDEENNYYSLGGDNHESQEERKGDE